MYQLGVDFKNMPPCRAVLLNKIKRTNDLSRMIKLAHNKNISTPKNGYIINSKNEMEIDYFSGDSYPTSITNIAADISEQDTEDDADLHITFSDGEYDYDEDFEDDVWEPNNKNK